MRHRDRNPGRRAAVVAAAAVLLLAAAAAAAGEVDWQQRRQDETIGLAARTELSIPTSPAFTLLGVDPAQVARPGFARDLNLDLILREDRLASDLAVDFQPVWMLAFADVDAGAYRRLGWLPRTLSTLSFSLGSSTRDTSASLAYGLRLTLYRATDPMLDRGYLDGVGRFLAWTPREVELELEIASLEADLELYDEQIAAAATDAERSAAAARRRDAVTRREALEAMILELDAATTAGLRRYARAYRDRHWNDAAVDVGCGQVLNYEDTPLQELRFASNGVGAWVSGAYGIGRNALLTGMWKYVDVGDEIDRFAGLNLRYGDASTTGFLEALWQDGEVRSLGFGAEFRVGGAAAVEAGLRATVDDDFDLRDLVPQIKVNWSLLGKAL